MKSPRLFCAITVLAVTILTLSQALASGAVGGSTLEEVRQSIEANGYSWTAARTPISELAAAERQRLLGLRIPDDYEARLDEIRRAAPQYSALSLPSSFDWTDSAGVSPVRYQQCGDCWAQCAIGLLEAKLRIFDGDTTLLSVQQAIDCNFGGSSCGGGWWGHVYDVYRFVGGVSETCYPYQGADGTCSQDSCPIAMNIDSWEYIDTTVVSIKTHLMTHGPIAVGMTVFDDFGYYSGGCYETSLSGPTNHGVLIVGWDDSMCGGAGAWHIKNSWSAYWGVNGYAWMKYGTAGIGDAAAIVHYTPRNRAQLAYASHIIDDSAGDGDGLVDPGETVTLPVTLENVGWEDATNVSATLMTPTPGVTVLTGSATYPGVGVASSEQSDSPHFSFSVDGSALCGLRIEFVLSATSDQGISTDTFGVLVGEAVTVFSDDVESDLGWMLGVPGDDATAGLWKWVNPRGSMLDDSILIQTELDHTPLPGRTAFVTANTKRTWPADYGDVDGGKTTLLSPVLDLSSYASARLRYWRWYTNDSMLVSDDVWLVDASGDSGDTWTNLEYLTDSEREWVVMEYDLGAHICLSDKVLVRFVASDYYNDSIVEAGVDDFEITGCPYWVDAEAASVEVVSPDGGEELVEGTEVEVRWSGSDDYGIRHFTVVASYDGGGTYPDTLGVIGGLDTSLVWEVPAGEYEQCKVGVEALDRGYNTTFDASDSTFHIVRDIAGVSVTTDDLLPEGVQLIGSRLNPFTGSTHIVFGVPKAASVRLCVYDARGRMVRRLLDSRVSAGYHSVLWDGRTGDAVASPGVYFLRLETEGISKTAKVVLAR